MMYRFKYFFLFFFFSFIAKGQVNLVPNPSFEDTIGDCQSQMGISNMFTNVKNWKTNHVFSTPDYYNACSNSITYPHWSTIPYNSYNYQYPKTGNAFIGIVTCVYNDQNDSSKTDSEYISTKFITPLKQNTCYYAVMFVNLSNVCELATNQISMLFSISEFTTAPRTFTNTIQPQIQWDTTQYFTDTLNWIKISGTFLAQGGEQYLTIGNFKDGVNTNKKSLNSNFIQGIGTVTTRFFSDILVDDVSLYEIPTPQLESNAITICPNADTLVLGDTARIQTHYQWFANGNAIDTTSYIKVKPNQTTTYVLQSTNCITNTQTIVVTYSNNCTPPEPIVVVEPIIPNVFTPNNDSINDVWRFSLGKGNTLKDIAIFNRWGNLLYQKTNNLSQTTVLWDGRTTSGEETPNGVYFYVFQYTDANGDEHKKNGYITLIR